MVKDPISALKVYEPEFCYSLWSVPETALVSENGANRTQTQHTQRRSLKERSLFANETDEAKKLQ